MIHLLILGTISGTTELLLRKSLPTFMSSTVVPILPSSRLSISALKFRSLINLDFSLEKVRDMGIVSFFLCELCLDSIFKKTKLRLFYR